MATVMLAVVAAPAMAGHFIDFDSVDNKEIRYENNTKYKKTFAHAKEQWNAVGKVDFKGDSAKTIADLEFKDTRQPSAAWAGRYTNRKQPLIDFIELETSYMDSATANEMKNVMIHEMGHALGIDDHSSKSWDSIMYKSVRGWTTVHSHDKEDYKELW